ncbi:hypothetical protein ACFQZX_07320 [Mucilaginibacter litoreus]|uniref:DUF4377 domain-containing protein n=1 Tax=Mucilaginibacter litoreus TaxID=1048221 RepID=A0ABW3ARS6_9SPHI
MRKLLSILCVAILLFTASSCKKETYVTPGAQTIFTDTKSWITDDGGITYTTDIPVPDIDSYFDSSGAVLVYNDLGGGEFEQLPSVYGGITYRFTYTDGHVYIDAQNADGDSITPMPPKLNLKIVLVD